MRWVGLVHCNQTVNIRMKVCQEQSQITTLCHICFFVWWGAWTLRWIPSQPGRKSEKQWKTTWCLSTGLGSVLGSLFASKRFGKRFWTLVSDPRHFSNLQVPLLDGLAPLCWVQYTDRSPNQGFQEKIGRWIWLTYPSGVPLNEHSTRQCHRPSLLFSSPSQTNKETDGIRNVQGSCCRPVILRGLPRGRTWLWLMKSHHLAAANSLHWIWKTFQWGKQYLSYSISVCRKAQGMIFEKKNRTLLNCVKPF